MSTVIARLPNVYRALFGIFLITVMPRIASADLVRGLENYLQILKSQKSAEELSPAEALEVVDIHSRLQGFGSPTTGVGGGGGCEAVIETQIDGEFEGWEGETIFKLMNGQIWQQASYSYHYHYAYMPGVLIYPAGGGCTMKVEDVDDTIPVHRIR